MLYLTINTVDSSVTQNGITLSADVLGAAYQWLDCNNGFSILTGDTNQSFTATANGNYAVEITQNGCVDTSACYNVSTIGMMENSLRNKLIFYPNPTNYLVTIKIEGYNGSFEVEIYDLQGRLLETTKSRTISLKKYSKGIYIFRVSYGDKTEEVRVVRD